MRLEKADVNISAKNSLVYFIAIVLLNSNKDSVKNQLA